MLRYAPLKEFSHLGICREGMKILSSGVIFKEIQSLITYYNTLYNIINR